MFNHHNGGLLLTDTYYLSSYDQKMNIIEVNEHYIKRTFEFVERMNTGPSTFAGKTLTYGEFILRDDQARSMQQEPPLR